MLSGSPGSSVPPRLILPPRVTEVHTHARLRDEKRPRLSALQRETLCHCPPPPGRHRVGAELGATGRQPRQRGPAEPPTAGKPPRQASPHVKQAPTACPHGMSPRREPPSLPPTGCPAPSCPSAGRRVCKAGRQTGLLHCERLASGTTSHLLGCVVFKPCHLLRSHRDKAAGMSICYSPAAQARN